MYSSHRCRAAKPCLSTVGRPDQDVEYRMADARRLGGSWRVPDPEVCMALCPAELMMCFTALAGAGWMLLSKTPPARPRKAR